jgi:hypothetical protein
MHRRERGRTSAGFRDQLLARLRNHAHKRGISVQRVQQRVAFERLLARLGHTDEWVLKGGFALELRYGWESRPTRDIDLRTTAEPHAALARLRTAIARSKLADHFAFDLAEAGTEMQGAPGGSIRVRVVARLAGTTFADFHIDLSSGDALVGPPDLLLGSDLLLFAGIEPIRFPAYPVAQQLAEKLHAYTLPRRDQNTRIKDFVDLAAIPAMETIAGDALLASLRATFDTRATHAIPAALPEPPTAWSAAFARLVAESPFANGVDLHEAHVRAARFWDPVLSGAARGGWWLPSEQVWRLHEARPSAGG